MTTRNDDTAEPPATRLLVLGIDAASPDLIHRWIAEDRLPAIRALMERGTSGRVDGVEGLFVGSTWPSFYTGLNPAGHGVHRIEQLESGTYGFHRPLEAEAGPGGTPFWTRASRAGRRVAVLDVPLSRLEPGLNGVQTVEWGGHDAVFGFRTWPPELAERIRATVGPYPLPDDCDRPRRTAAEFEAYLRGLEDAVERKTALTLDLMDEGPWDLFLQVFTEAHCAGHQMWHLHDPTHPAHDPALRDALGDPLERVYRAVDRAVGAIVARAPGARVLVHSNHGMGPFRGMHALLPGILARLGATVPRRRFAGGIRRRLASLLPSRPPEHRGIAADVDRSPCFAVDNGAPVAAIRLNLVGREPRGVLRPGAEADAFCERLARDLLEIVDERTGGPLVARVARTDDLFAGPRRHDLPDLLVEWSAEVATGTLAHGPGAGATIRAASPRMGTLEATNAYVRTGDHVPTGFFVLAGPGIARGRRDEPIDVTDLHPTICGLLDLPDPELDGAVVDDLLPHPDGGAEAP